jgi:hypothetical protein
VVAVPAPAVRVDEAALKSVEIVDAVVSMRAEAVPVRRGETKLYAGMDLYVVPGW